MNKTQKFTWIIPYLMGVGTMFGMGRLEDIGWQMVWGVFGAFFTGFIYNNRE